MAFYLLQVSYTSDGWKNQINKPQNRARIIEASVKKAGGKLEAFYYTFGEYDVITILQMPDNIGAAALSVAVAAGGAVSKIKTTPLMTALDGIKVLKKASAVKYNPPGK